MAVSVSPLIRWPNSVCHYITSSVIVDDKEWAQLTETTGINFDSIEAACNTVAGECSGSVGGKELTGWTLASIYDVGELFSEFTPHTGGVDGGHNEINSSWAPLFLSVFTPTYLSLSKSMAWGRTRTPSPTISYHTYSGFVEDSFDPLAADRVSTGHTVHGGTVAHIGAWLYKDATVPAPASIWLFGAGLMALAGIKRKR